MHQFASNVIAESKTSQYQGLEYITTLERVSSWLDCNDWIGITSTLVNLKSSPSLMKMTFLSQVLWRKPFLDHTWYISLIINKLLFILIICEKGHLMNRFLGFPVQDQLITSSSFPSLQTFYGRLAVILVSH